MGDTPVNLPNDRRGDYLAYASVLLLFYVITLIFAVVALGLKIDPVELTLVSMVVSAVVGAVGTILAFQFGSSKGSQAKDALLTPTPPPGATPTPASDPTIQGPTS